MAGENLHAGQGEILFGSVSQAFCVTDSCLANFSELYCEIQPQLHYFKGLSAQSVMAS